MHESDKSSAANPCTARPNDHITGLAAYPRVASDEGPHSNSHGEQRGVNIKHADAMTRAETESAQEPDADSMGRDEGDGLAASMPERGYGETVGGQDDDEELNSPCKGDEIAGRVGSCEERGLADLLRLKNAFMRGEV